MLQSGGMHHIGIQAPTPPPQMPRTISTILGGAENSMAIAEIDNSLRTFAKCLKSDVG